MYIYIYVYVRFHLGPISFFCCQFVRADGWTSTSSSAAATQPRRRCQEIMVFIWSCPHLPLCPNLLNVLFKHMFHNKFPKKWQENAWIMFAYALCWQKYIDIEYSLFIRWPWTVALPGAGTGTKKNSNHFKVIKEFLALPPLRSHKENGSLVFLWCHGLITAKSTWT